MADHSSVHAGVRISQMFDYADLGATHLNAQRKLLRALQALLQGAVLEVALNTPPGSPSDGNAYILGASPTGAWSGNANKVAVWAAQKATDDTNTKVPEWEFYTPKAGWRFFDENSGHFWSFNGTSWVDDGAPGTTGLTVHGSSGDLQTNDGAGNLGSVPQSTFATPADVSTAAATAEANANDYTDAAVAGITGNDYYDVPMAYKDGPPTSSEVIGGVVVVRSVTFPANFSGSSGYIRTNPTASFVISVKDDGVEIGTITISTLGVFTFATSSGTSKVVAAGSRLEFVAPASADATAAYILATLAGTA